MLIIKGRLSPQPNGHITIRVLFSIRFKSGGTEEFYKALIQAGETIFTNVEYAGVPIYRPPAGPWYALPPPAFHPPHLGYHKWRPPTGIKHLIIIVELSLYKIITTAA